VLVSERAADPSRLILDAGASDGDVSQRAQVALKVSMLEGALHAIMVGVAESYLGAFAVELGHGPRRLAVLSTLPLFAGACCQLFSPLLCSWLGNRKRVAVAGALGQTASIAALLAIAATESTSLGALLSAKLGFWVCGGAMAPAWNAWMASLTLHTHRPRYFGKRSALNHVALLLAFGAAGFALHSAGLHVLKCFVALFGVAFVARLSSAVALTFQVDIEAPRLSTLAEPAMFPRLRRAVSTGHFGVALYLAALAFGTQLAAPFFTPYMLRELALDYRSFAALSALSILAKAVTFPCCHNLAERFGLRRVLCWAGAGVAVIPMVWAVSAHLPALILAHIVGGAVWAAVEYASFQLLLDNAPAELTAEFFSVSNALTGLAQVVGALSGGWLLGQPGVTYPEIFMLSGFMRGLPLLLLFSALRREHFPTWLRVLYTRISTVRPVAGAAQQPILAASELRPSKLPPPVDGPRGAGAPLACRK
jgi:MFS family permease